MLRNIAKKKNANPVQVALAWLLAQKPFIVPIPGMDKMEYIHDNMKPIDVELTNNDLKEIDSEPNYIKQNLMCNAHFCRIFLLETYCRRLLFQSFFNR